MLCSHRLKDYCESWRLIGKYNDHNRGDKDSCDIFYLTHFAYYDDKSHNNNLNHNYQTLKNNKKSNLTKEIKPFGSFYLQKYHSKINVGDGWFNWA